MNYKLKWNFNTVLLSWNATPFDFPDEKALANTLIKIKTGCMWSAIDCNLPGYLGMLEILIEILQRRLDILPRRMNFV